MEDNRGFMTHLNKALCISAATIALASGGAFATTIAGNELNCVGFSEKVSAKYQKWRTTCNDGTKEVLLYSNTWRDDEGDDLLQSAQISLGETLFATHEQAIRQVLSPEKPNSIGTFTKLPLQSVENGAVIKLYMYAPFNRVVDPVPTQPPVLVIPTPAPTYRPVSTVAPSPTADPRLIGPPVPAPTVAPSPTVDPRLIGPPATVAPTPTRPPETKPTPSPTREVKPTPSPTPPPPPPPPNPTIQPGPGPGPTPTQASCPPNSTPYAVSGITMYCLCDTGSIIPAGTGHGNCNTVIGGGGGGTTTPGPTPTISPTPAPTISPAPTCPPGTGWSIEGGCVPKETPGPSPSPGPTPTSGPFCGVDVDNFSPCYFDTNSDSDEQEREGKFVCRFDAIVKRYPDNVRRTYHVSGNSGTTTEDDIGALCAALQDGVTTSVQSFFAYYPTPVSCVAEEPWVQLSYQLDGVVHKVRCSYSASFSPQ